MTINIVPSDSGSWILARMLEELRRVDCFKVGPLDLSYEQNFFFTYRSALQNWDRIACVDGSRLSAFFTHPESFGFAKVAQKVEKRVFMNTVDAESYIGISVPVGIDPAFRPKLRVGIPGRLYKSGRKGERRLAPLLENENFEVVLQPTQRSKDSREKYLSSVARFYDSLDVVVILSEVEGGPMGALEAVSMGVKVFAPFGLGFTNQLPVVQFDPDDYEGLLSRLEFEASEKLANFRNLIGDWNWSTWAVTIRNYLRQEC